MTPSRGLDSSHTIPTFCSATGRRRASRQPPASGPEKPSLRGAGEGAEHTATARCCSRQKSLPPPPFRLWSGCRGNARAALGSPAPGTARRGAALGRWEVRHGGSAPAPGRRIRTAAGGAEPCHGSRRRRTGRKRMRRTAPRGALRKIIKKHKPHLRLAANTDLLVRRASGKALAVGGRGQG